MFACALLCLGHASADEMIIGDVIVPQGGTAEMTVGYRFTSTTDKVGFTLSVALPEGISFVKDEDGDPVYLKDATSIDKLNIVCIGDGNFAGQPSNASATIKGTEGTLLTLTLQADATMEVGRSYEVKVTKATFSQHVDGTVTDIMIPDFTFNVTIGEPADTRVILDENAGETPAYQAGVNVRVRRTINAGEWSTIVLPFAMTEAQVKAAFGDDVELGDFTGCETTEDADENIVGIEVKFTDVTTIEANHPYIIKVSEPVTEFTVDGVDIEAEEEPSVDCDRIGKGTKKDPYLYNSFVGTYVAQTVVPEQSLFLSGNQFWYSTGATKMKAFHAYFDFYDVLTEVESAGSRMHMVFNDDTPTEIRETMNYELRTMNYFDLQGRHVVKPAKGVYVQDGKKVVIK